MAAIPWAAPPLSPRIALKPPLRAARHHPMRHLRLLGLALFAASGHAAAYDWDDWPTHFTTAGGLEFGTRGTFQVDTNRFSHDTLPNGSARFDDLTTWRRKELYLYARKKGAFELVSGYDFQLRTWADNFLRLNTAKAGDFRLGQFKTPVGMDDGATATAATPFLERALPEATVHEGRRLGADWTWAPHPAWLLNLGYFDGGDLNGDNDGRTVAGRAVLTPVADARRLIHVGASASREWRDDELARLRAKPEAGLTSVRLLDTGNLAGTDHLDRWGLEGAWREGPFLLQGELLGVDVARRAGLRDFSGGGWYVFGSWMLTGESKPYRGGAFGNPKPGRDAGAVELLLRYSTLDLDDGAVRGGREHDWTLGANWYLGSHLKLQANYVRASSERGTLALDPRVFELRAQVAF